jgi:RNA polymerase primary sigma factor
MGAKLSTYAAWWIKQFMKRALANQSKTIRLPLHMVDKIARMRRIESRLTELTGCEPTDEELAEELGMSRAKLALLKRASQRPTSLDAPIDNGEREHRDIIKDEQAVDPLDALTGKNLHGQLDDLLAVLDERELQIIEARFGLSGKTPMTLEEVGRELGVTRERIRQIQNGALVRMRRALSKKDRPNPKPVAASV